MRFVEHCVSFVRNLDFKDDWLFLPGLMYRRGARRWRKIYHYYGHSFVTKRFGKVSIFRMASFVYFYAEFEKLSSILMYLAARRIIYFYFKINMHSICSMFRAI